MKRPRLHIVICNRIGAAMDDWRGCLDVVRFDRMSGVDRNGREIRFVSASAGNVAGMSPSTFSINRPDVRLSIREREAIHESRNALLRRGSQELDDLEARK